MKNRKIYVDSNRELLSEYRKQWRESHKDYISEKQKEYREANKMTISQKMKEYCRDNKEAVAERKRVYYKDNKQYFKDKREEYYNCNKEAIAKYNKEYFKTPQGREAKRRAGHKRRALKQQNGGSYTSSQWEECKQFFNNECAYSGQPITLDNSHIEHIVPLSKGGASYIWNLCTSLDRVNKSKNNSDMEEWYRKQEYFTEKRLEKIYRWQEYAFEKYHKDYGFEFNIGI